VEKFKINYANTTEHIAALLEEKNYDERGAWPIPSKGWEARWECWTSWRRA
jgi:hypothetical protein